MALLKGLDLLDAEPLPRLGRRIPERWLNATADGGEVVDP
jgi:hypothetical protein